MISNRPDGHVGAVGEGGEFAAEERAFVIHAATVAQEGESNRQGASMLRRLGIWALCGCSVALIWAAVFYLAGPSNGSYPSLGAVLHYLGNTALLPVTAPVALLGHHCAITWYWSTVINAGIYACAGLIVEATRLAIRSSVVRLHH